MRNITNTPFRDLIPGSISHDSTVTNAADALDAVLKNVATSIPNVLLYARLLRTAGHEDTQLLPALERLTGKSGLKALNTQELEQLAWQLHVDFRETARDDVTLASMVVDSIPWHRIKGTPESLRRAFALFGQPVVIEEYGEEDGTGDRWATYQLGLPEVATLEDVQRICSIAYETHPARCSLFRIYTDVYDVRPGGYDVGFYDVHAYDLYSGVDVPLSLEGFSNVDSVMVSFGRITRGTCQAVDVDILRARHRTRGAIVRQEDTLAYDLGFYDSTYEQAYAGFSRSRLRTVHYGQAIYTSHGWTGTWDDRTWRTLERIGHVREDCAFVRTPFAVIEGAYDVHHYDTLNAHYEQPLFDIVDNPETYDTARYDDSDLNRYTLRVDELVERKHPATLAHRAAQHPLYIQKTRTRTGAPTTAVSELYDVTLYDGDAMNSGFTATRVHTPVAGHYRQDAAFVRSAYPIIAAAYDATQYDALNTHYGQPQYLKSNDAPNYDTARYDSHELEFMPVAMTEIVTRTHTVTSAGLLMGGTVYRGYHRERQHDTRTTSAVIPARGWTGDWSDDGQGVWPNTWSDQDIIHIIHTQEGDTE